MNNFVELAESLGALGLLVLIARAWAAVRAWAIKRKWHRYFERARADFTQTTRVASADTGDGVAVSGPEPGRYERIGGLQ